MNPEFKIVDVKISLELPEDYYSLYVGFPNKVHFDKKGLKTGITVCSVGHIKISYFSKAVDRWKRNLRKQLGREKYHTALTRTALMYMDVYSASQYVDTRKQWDHMSVKETWSFNYQGE